MGVGIVAASVHHGALLGVPLAERLADVVEQRCEAGQPEVEGRLVTGDHPPLEALEAAGSQILLANTYHLLLRPGPEVFRKMGGIHRFMKWPGSVLTDSGGYQIFSLPHSRSMTEAGAVFQSYVDGQRILLSPELSIQTQMAIGSDIMMVLDQCIPSTADEKAARAALQVTQRWAVRIISLVRMDRNRPSCRISADYTGCCRN